MKYARYDIILQEKEVNEDLLIRIDNSEASGAIPLELLSHDRKEKVYGYMNFQGAKALGYNLSNKELLDKLSFLIFNTRSDSRCSSYDEFELGDLKVLVFRHMDPEEIPEDMRAKQTLYLRFSRTASGTSSQMGPGILMDHGKDKSLSKVTTSPLTNSSIAETGTFSLTLTLDTILPARRRSARWKSSCIKYQILSSGFTSTGMAPATRMPLKQKPEKMQVRLPSRNSSKPQRKRNWLDTCSIPQAAVRMRCLIS